MLRWDHDVHPLEEFMLLNQRPQVMLDTLSGGAEPWYQVDDTCQHWTVVDGRVRKVMLEPGEVFGRRLVELSQRASADRIAELLARRGCTFIQLVTVQEHRLVGGLGFRPVKSHLHCGQCIVQAIMQV